MNDHSQKNSEDNDANPSDAGFYPALDRFSAFSDGVFAIAITLLVLELPVPPVDVPLGPALLEAWPDFLGYIMSFAYIGGIWLTHAGLTRLMKHGDTVANGLNLLLLLLIALIPFSTSLMVTHLPTPQVGVAVFLYGINVLFASLTLSLLIRYIAHGPTLVADDIADEQLRRITKQRWVSIGVNSVAVALALIAPFIAVALYLIQTVLLLLFPLVGMRRRPARQR
jgi:uncharacterized membrane protein